MCFYLFIYLILSDFAHGGSIIPPEEGEETGNRQQTALPAGTICCRGVSKPTKRVPSTRAVE